jgi:hypothetical protein
MAAAMKEEGYDLEEKNLGWKKGSIKALLDAKWKPEDDIEEGEEKEIGLKPTGPVIEYVDAAVFPSTNEWELPDLRLDMMADVDCLPEKTWAHGLPLEPKGLYIYRADGFGFLSKVKQGVISFYTHDTQFLNVWDDASDSLKQILTWDLMAIMTPDFSTYSTDPLAVQLWSLYRSRWVGRYWQEAGLKIIPSMALMSKRGLPLANAGIPRHTPVLATQAQTGLADGETGTIAQREVVRAIHIAIEEIEPKVIMIYGSNHRKKLEPLLPNTVEYRWYETWKTVRVRAYEQSKKK